MITQQKNSVKTGSKAGAGEVDNLIREYKKTRWAPNSERIGKPDSLSAWYSIEDMENFLALVKSKGRRRNQILLWGLSRRLCRQTGICGTSNLGSGRHQIQIN